MGFNSLGYANIFCGASQQQTIAQPTIEHWRREEDTEASFPPHRLPPTPKRSQSLIPSWPTSLCPVPLLPCPNMEQDVLILPFGPLPCLSLGEGWRRTLKATYPQGLLLLLSSKGYPLGGLIYLLPLLSQAFLALLLIAQEPLKHFAQRSWQDMSLSAEEALDECLCCDERRRWQRWGQTSTVPSAWSTSRMQPACHIASTIFALLAADVEAEGAPPAHCAGS